MKQFFIIVFFLLTPLLWRGAGGEVFSQNRGNIWCFGDSAGINFNTQPPTPIFSNARGRGSSTSVCDSTGQLLFYARSHEDLNTSHYNGIIWNKNNQWMQNGDSIICIGAYKELIIIPFPNNPHIYYLFDNDMINSMGFFYSMIDLTQNGGLGAVIQKNTLINSYNLVDGLTAVKHANGRDWWVLGHDWSGNGAKNFYTYLITPLGIGPSVLQQIGSLHQIELGDISFSPDGKRIIAVNNYGLIELFDFDRCTGLISNPQLISTANFSAQKIYFGCAFSPNSDVLYVSVTHNLNFGDSLRLYQFDLLAPNIAASKITIYNAVVPASGGKLALAPDKRIYWSCLYTYGYPYADSVRNMYNENLSVINNPDVVGLGCNFQPFSFYLGGKRTYWGLPNNVDYDMRAISGSLCDSLGLAVEEIPSQPQNIFIYYHTDWQTAFINAQGLKGKNYVMQVHDMMGRCVFKEEGKLNSQYYTRDLHMQAFSSGVYIVSLITNSQQLAGKFVKE